MRDCRVRGPESDRPAFCVAKSQFPTSAKYIRGNLPKSARKVAASDLLAAPFDGGRRSSCRDGVPKPAGFSAIVGIYLSIVPLLAYASLEYSRLSSGPATEGDLEDYFVSSRLI
jgi:hypothetical protein